MRVNSLVNVFGPHKVEVLVLGYFFDVHQLVGVQILNDALDVRQSVASAVEQSNRARDLIGVVRGRHLTAVFVASVALLVVVVHLELSAAHDLEPVYHALNGAVRVDVRV